MRRRDRDELYRRAGRLAGGAQRARPGLRIRGRAQGEFGKKFYYGTRGTGGVTRNDPDNRPADVFGGKVTLHAGGACGSYLVLPIIP